jgi:hypothetical protein
MCIAFQLQATAPHSPPLSLPTYSSPINTNRSLSPSPWFFKLGFFASSLCFLFLFYQETISPCIISLRKFTSFAAKTEKGTNSLFASL